MGQCQRCGEKLGFFGTQYQCEVCKKPYCEKCSPVRVIEFHSEGPIPYKESEEVDHYICSIDCSYKIYLRFLKIIGPKRPIDLIDGDHVSVIVGENSETPKQLFIDYFYFDRKTLRDQKTLIPEMRPMYERIKEDLIKREIGFKESHENYM